MAGAPILPRELWLISCDGQACFKWSQLMVEFYLPIIRFNIARVSTGFDLFFQSNAGGAIGIMVEGVSSDVLKKIDLYMRYVCLKFIVMDYNTLVSVGEFPLDWLVDFLSNLDADMMTKLKSETEKRCVQLVAAGPRLLPGGDMPMLLLADLTANLSSICMDQQPPQIRATRGPDYSALLDRVVQKMLVERRNERGYFGNV